MTRRAYIIEYPDKDLLVVLVDNGDRQAIMTGGTQSYREGGPTPTDIFMDDYAKRGYEVLGFRSTLNEETSDYGHHLRSWHDIETGEAVPVPLGKEWDPAGALDVITADARGR